MAEKNPGTFPPTEGSRPAPDILARIISKEHELEGALRAAEEEANAILLEARDRIAATIAARRGEAEREAERVREEILALARCEAAAVRQQGERDLAALVRGVENRIERCGAHLLTIVLPSGGSERRKS